MIQTDRNSDFLSISACRSFVLLNTLYIYIYISLSLSLSYVPTIPLILAQATGDFIIRSAWLLEPHISKLAGGSGFESLRV